MKSVSDISKKGKLYQEVAALKGELLHGKVLVIDPSIGSTSSSPGWAYYQAGVLVDSGILFTGGSHLALWQRARKLGQDLGILCDEYEVDVLIYEDIPATSGFNQNAIASLLKAVGIVLACTTSSHVLGVHPASWKNYVRPQYKKGDKEDAIEMGWVAISLAAHIQAEHTREAECDGDTVSGGESRPRRRKRG